MRTLTISLFCFLLFPVNSVFSQDTAIKKIKFNIGANVWMRQNFENNSKISMPAFIKNLRKNTTRLPINFETLSDNPLIHGATYFTIKSSAAYKNKVKLNVDLFAEHRGVSYGIFNKKNLLLYPVIKIEVKDTFNVFNRVFMIKGNAGMFLNEKMDEGLSIYNIDAQGYKLDIERKKWLFQYTIYGDFYNGIGLNIDDINAFALKKEIGKGETAEIGVSINFNTPPFQKIKNNYSINLFTHKKFTTAKVYTQIAYRPENSNYGYYRLSNAFNQKLSALAGVEFKYKLRGFESANVFEARYYGAIFNENHHDFRLRYRQPAANYYETYANTVGDYLYPLRKFNTPFSQWAVYTEYINHSIFSLNLRGSMAKPLNKKMSINLQYDINYISAKNNFANPNPQINVLSNFIYPFFTASLTYKVIEEVGASLLITNQSMNLDIGYPTHYLLSNPRLGIALKTAF